MKFDKGTTKEEKIALLKARMKEVAGELGMIEAVRGGIQMGQAQYNSLVGAKRRAELRNEFGRLQAQHKRLYFS